MEALKDARSDRDANTIVNLVLRYPYMFSSPQSRFKFYRGWLPTFSDVCMEIDDLLGAEKQGFHWRQVKEKLGALRLYFGFSSVERVQQPRATNDESFDENPDRSRLKSAISDVVSRACKASAATCVACGQSAALGWTDGNCATTCYLHRLVLIEDPEAFWRLSEFADETTAKELVESALQRPGSSEGTERTR